jgi:hypothetical protein
LLEDFDNLRFQPVHALGESLDNEAGAVAIDNQRREKVTFGRDKAVGLRFARHLPPETRGCGYALSEKGAVEGALVTCEESQSNLRFAAVKRLPPEMMLSVLNANYGPGAGFVCVQQVGTVNPHVAGDHPLHTAL